MLALQSTVKCHGTTTFQMWQRTCCMSKSERVLVTVPKYLAENSECTKYNVMQKSSESSYYDI